MCVLGKVNAAPHIEVIALFENKAMLHIDQDRVLISVGEVTEHGIMLVSADAHGAVIEVDGVRRKYLLGNVVRTTNDSEAISEPEILVYQGTDTMFRLTF